MSDKPRILIVDDEPFNLDLLEQELETLGYEVVSATNGQEALNKIIGGAHDHVFPGIVVADIKMPRMDGLELMKRALELDPDLPVILVTAYGDIPMAVKAICDGAYDFVERPFDADRLREKVKRAVEKRSLVLENRALRAELACRSGIEVLIIGKSPLMVELRKTVANLAETDTNVLILGETGTGKEVVARCLHDFSSRSRNRFVPVNCGAIPENMFESELFGYEPGAFTDAKKRRLGRLEHAHNGTLFLDEIESMPLHLQVKLLRALEERVIERLGSNDEISVDFRVVAATKADLKAAAENGEFRDDLYFRLNVAEVLIPPLRDRREDIPLLFEFFTDRLTARYEREAPMLSRDDLRELMAHSWPGNVRELRNVAERHVLGLSKQGRRVAEFIRPDVFEELAHEAAARGFTWIVSAPFARSSYRAELPEPGPGRPVNLANLTSIGPLAHGADDSGATKRGAAQRPVDAP